MALPDVARFTSDSGAVIYRLPCEAFPGLVTYAYLVLEAGPATLVDTGSGYGASTRQILQGLQEVRHRFAEAIELGDIRRVLITHGHIDHCGGLPSLLEEPAWSRDRPEIVIHALDRRILTGYEERVVVATKALRFFLEQAGVGAELLPDLVETYGFSKQHMRSVPVDRVIEDGQMLDGMRVHHMPGHCPGQVCLELGDVLLSADHVLSRTSPHQSPESITAYNGLGHYLESLARIKRLSGVRVALGGHEDPVENFAERVTELERGHRRKLQRVLDLVARAEEPRTIAELTWAIYPHVEGFHVLLALEEIGAHVEFLYQHGELGVANLDEVERAANPPLRYRTLST